MAAIYHVNIGFPVGLRDKLPARPFGLWYTSHTRHAATDDRYGTIGLPDGLDPRDKKRVKVVEVKVNDAGEPYEVLYRVKYSATHDLCLVVMLHRDYMVKTVWLNERGDTHSTLDTLRYSVPA